MPFGIIGRTGPGMRQILWFGDRSTKRGTFGANLGRVIVTNGDFTAYVCDSAASRLSSQITLGKHVFVCYRLIAYRQNCEYIKLHINTNFSLPFLKV